jgi:hypothetical protein
MQVYQFVQALARHPWSETVVGTDALRVRGARIVDLPHACTVLDLLRALIVMPPAAPLDDVAQITVLAEPPPPDPVTRPAARTAPPAPAGPARRRKFNPF